MTRHKKSSRTAYYLQILMHVAINENAVALNIAKDIKVCISATETHLSALRNAGFIVSKRGPGGGYSLDRPVSRILISDVAQLAVRQTNLGLADDMLCDLWFDRTLETFIAYSIEDPVLTFSVAPRDVVRVLPR